MHVRAASRWWSSKDGGAVGKLLLMAHRSREMLEAWIEEFRDLGHTMPGSIKVMQQDGIDGADTGLVGVHFANAVTVTYLQPDADGSGTWMVTMEPREEAVVLDSADMLDLANELAVVAALCAFLQGKSTPDTEAASD